jgi:hypothetical protein
MPISEGTVVERWITECNLTSQEMQLRGRILLVEIGSMFEASQMDT